MNKFYSLIKEMCSDGVEYIKLKEIGEIFTGLTGKNKKDFEKGNSRYITYTNIYNNPSVVLDKKDFVNVLESENQNYIIKGDILITGSSESIEDSGMIAVVMDEPNEKIYLNSFCFGFRLNEEYKNKIFHGYSKHLFRSKYFRNQILKCSFGVTRYNLNKKMFLELKIPIPPIEVQEKIVNVLDKFNELEAELEAELDNRKQQYDFWSKKLLNKSNDNMIKMNDICINIASGRCYDRSENGKYPVYGSTGTISTTNSYSYDTEKILIARVGANAGYVHIAEGKYDVTDNTLIVNLKENYNMKYIYYYLQNFNLNKMAKGGGQPLITAKQIKELEINMPLPEEQEKIVRVLDKFDKLINDVSEGIPAEIELRKKQYEYYRNKLLSFKEVTA